MGATIPVLLQEDLNSDASTLTIALKIKPVISGYSPYGICMTNKALVITDGDGPLEYSPIIGMIPSAMIQTGDLSVDNATVDSLIPEFDIPVSEADLQSGAYDFAEFVAYLVNYEDLSRGVFAFRTGTIGRVTVRDGLSFINELRGLAQGLKQTLCARDSISCRAIFGSQPPGTGGGVKEEREYCGFDAESIFQAGTVSAVGLENTRTFSIAGMGFPSSGAVADFYALGLVRWVTGMNAGREYEIEDSTTGGQISLQFPTAFPIQIGDQLLYREGCNKIARDENRGCKYWFAAEWVNHFRGEPDIPISDALAGATPGGSQGPGRGGSTSTVAE